MMPKVFLKLLMIKQLRQCSKSGNQALEHVQETGGLSREQEIRGEK